MTGISLRRVRLRRQRLYCRRLPVCLILVLWGAFIGLQLRAQPVPPNISKAAAQSCDAKIKRLESFAAAASDGKKKQTTQLTENELNSYLALTLSPNYHPSLRAIRLKFEEARLQAVATIDFDRLEFNSTQLLTGLMRKMLTGIHSLTVVGNLVTGAGKVSFKLIEARFDSLTLPNLLVSEIISAVGRKQNPPIDPMQPSDLPYRIEKVDMRPGYIVIYQ